MHADARRFLDGLEQFGIKLGLHNIRAVLAGLGHPEQAFPSVHIAGTNGKGSVSAIMEAALRAAGHITGRYTSPHLVNLEERFAVNGQPVAAAEAERALAAVKDAVARCRAQGTLDVMPTFFEATTAMAFEVFRSARVDVAVCEVGLGGRLDATNVLAPCVTVITSIGLDHQQHLGSTIEAIAAEKAGIIKPSTPVVVGNLAAGALDVIRKVAEAHGTLMLRANVDTTVEQLGESPEGRAQVKIVTPTGTYGPVWLGLAGRHQMDNAVVAVRALETMTLAGDKVPAPAITKGLRDVRWPGRLDLRHEADGRTLLLDAAHNVDGADSLARFLETRERCPLVFGASGDKDARGILQALSPVVSAVVLTQASNPRAARAEDLSGIAGVVAPHLPRHVARTPREALDIAWRMHPHVVVAGSIFLLGDILADREMQW